MIKCFSTGKKEQEKYDNKERVIGTWFGKPLYRKVISITPQELATYKEGINYLYPIDIDIDYLIRADLIIKFDDGTEGNRNAKKCFSSNATGNNNYECAVSGMTNGQIKFAIGSGIANYLTSNVNIVLEYTKNDNTNQGGNNENEEF